MSENEKMRLVYCSPFGCEHVFEVPENNIKDVSSEGFCFFNEKVTCVQCGKKHKGLWDYEIRKENTNREIINANSPISCPHCNSTQLHTSDKGYSVAKGLAGSVVAGGIGLLAGFHGSKKVMITCLKCNHKWETGK